MYINIHRKLHTIYFTKLNSKYLITRVGVKNTFFVKEVIQPQVPLRLPCYDFTPVADLTVVGCPPYGSANRLRVKPTPMV